MFFNILLKVKRWQDLTLNFYSKYIMTYFVVLLLNFNCMVFNNFLKNKKHHQQYIIEGTRILERHPGAPVGCPK